jgi:outer membrane immunogenic protein
MDWFGTVRGRLGFVVHEHLLLYTSGGLAVGNVKHTLSDDCVGCGNSAFNLGTFSQSDTETKVGWTIGGGAELVHDSRWLFRAEAFFVDFGSSDHFYLITTPAGTGEASTKWKDEMWLGRIGAAYRFDWVH